MKGAFFFLSMSIAAGGTGSQAVSVDHSSPRQVHVYESISDTSTEVSRIKLDTERGLLIYPATYTEMATCPQRSGACFSSPRLSFCAPTDSEIETGRWRCGDKDMEFRLKGRAALRLFGEADDYLIISWNQVDFYYNRHAGLMMVKIIGGDMSEVYWSSDRRGFGAVAKAP